MRVFTVCLLALILLSLPGCWSKTELEEQAFIMTVGVDQAPNSQYLFSFNILVPGKTTQAGGAEAESLVFSFKDYTIKGASDQLYKVLDRKPFFGQTQLVLISEDVARQGISPHLDFLSRYFRLRRSVNLMVVKGNVAKLMTTDYSGSMVLARNLGDRITMSNNEGLNEKISVGNFLTKLAVGKIEPVVPGVQAIPPNGDNIQYPKQQDEMALGDLAVFKSDRFIGWLGPAATRGYMYTTNKAKRINLTAPFVPGEYVHYLLLKPRTRKKVEVVNDKPLIKLKFTADADVEEAAFSHKMSVQEWNESVPQLASKCDSFIANEIKSALHQAQTVYHSDIFGLAQLIYRDKPELWRQIGDQWNTLYPSLPVEVEVDITIKRAGATSNPPTSNDSMTELPSTE